ncbi:MAG: hypothetical protein ABGZ35_23245, partial [Planctomycetaceae bacterium]
MPRLGSSTMIRVTAPEVDENTGSKPTRKSLARNPGGIAAVSATHEKCGTMSPAGRSSWTVNEEHMVRRLSISLSIIVASVVCPGTRSLGGQEVNKSVVLGKEFASTVRVDAHEVTVEGVLFLPEKIAQAHGVITFVNWGLGLHLYEYAEWRELAQRMQAVLLLVAIRSERPGGAQQTVRNATAGGGEGVLLLLESLAEQSGRPELGSAKLLLWGHSAAGSFGLTFAALHPQRTIAFVRYHSHLRNLPVDVESAAKVPGLLLAGEADQTAGVEDSKTLWQRGRLLAAPWTFGIEPGISHGSREGLKQANTVTKPWVTAVYKQRIVSGDGELRSVSERSAWLECRVPPCSGSADRAAADGGSVDAGDCGHAAVAVRLASSRRR